MKLLSFINITQNRQRNIAIWQRRSSLHASTTVQLDACICCFFGQVRVSHRLHQNIANRPANPRRSDIDERATSCLNASMPTKLPQDCRPMLYVCPSAFLRPPSSEAQRRHCQKAARCRLLVPTGDASPPSRGSLSGPASLLRPLP